MSFSIKPYPSKLVIKKDDTILSFLGLSARKMSVDY